MNIIETDLKFSSLSKRSATNRIILHNADAKKCSAADIHRWHKERGWSGMGYHFLVRKDGTIERGRPEDTVGAHAQGYNSDSIGVCFEGAFMTEKMGQTQVNAGRELISYLKNKYGISKVQKHKDVNPTNCPGANFPFDTIVNGKVKTDRWVQDNSGWWYRHADGSYTTSNWEQIDGVWYYFDKWGYLLSGWQNIDGTWYYLNEKHDGAYGAMKTGWVYVNENWFYLDSSGAMYENMWHVEGETWYYLKSGGYMARNELLQIGDELFVFLDNGHMARTNDRGALV